MGENYEKQAAKIDKKNEKTAAKYKNKPGEVFYLIGGTTGSELPYHYDKDGNIVSGAPKSEEQTTEQTTEQSTEQINNFAYVKKDLEATLVGDAEKNNGISTLTIEEKLNLFPEFEGDKKLFKSVEKNIIANNDVLKKKDLVPLSYKLKEESKTSQSEIPSTSETTTTEKEEIKDDEFSKELIEKYSLDTLKHTQKYITNKWALPTEENPDGLFNQKAYDDLLLLTEEEVKEEEDISIEFDADKFRKGINTVEASGNMDYSLVSKLKTKAIGPYQFIYSHWKEVLKDEFGVNSREDFIGNKEAQEGLMDYLLEDKPGRYTFMANALEKKYSEQIKELGLSHTDLMGMEHFVGHGEARKLFAKVRDGKITKEEFFKTVPGGLNNSIGTYLEKYRGGMVEEEGEETGFIMENPLDDPNLMAGGTEEIQSYVSTELSNEEDEDILGSKNNPIQAIPRIVEAEEGKYYQNQQNPDLNYIFHNGQYVGTETSFYRDFISKDIEMPLSYNDWIIDDSSVLTIEEVNERQENPEEFGKTKEDYISYFKEQTGIKGQFSEGSDVFIPKDYSGLEYPELEIKRDFHLGTPSSEVYQNFLDYPELIMYDLYSGDASTLFEYEESNIVEKTGYYQEGDYQTNPAESTAPIGSAANPYFIATPASILSVPVPVNDILKNLNIEINGENSVKWIPSSERGYGTSSEMETYGFGLDQQELVFDYNTESGTNDLYMTSFHFDESGTKIYDKENRVLISSFESKNNISGTTRGDIYKGIVLQQFAGGRNISEVDNQIVEYIIDAKETQYQTLKQNHYKQILESLPASILNFEEGFDITESDIIRDYIIEAKTGLVKDLIKNNIYIESAIRGGEFETYVQNNLYHNIRSNFVDKIYSVIEDNMGNETQTEITGGLLTGQTVGESLLKEAILVFDSDNKYAGKPRHQADIYRDAIETELEKDKYEWMGEAQRESLGDLIMRKYKMEKGSGFKEKNQENINNLTEEYNKKTEEVNEKLESKEPLGEDEFEGEDASRIIFISPGENQSNLKEQLQPIIDDLRNKNLSNQDIDNYLQDVYGVNFNTATGFYDYTDKYHSAYREIHGKAEMQTWKDWNEANPQWNSKNILAESWEGTITAWGLSKMGIDTKNADYDIEYSWFEETVLMPVLSIVGDPVTYGTGWAGGFVTKTMFNGARNKLVSNIATMERRLINRGMSPENARTVVSARFGEITTKLSNRQNIIGSGLGLSSYTTSAELVMHTEENWQDFKTSELLKNGLVNFALGGGIGHLSNLTTKANARLDARYGKNSRQYKLIDDGAKWTIDDQLNALSSVDDAILWTRKVGNKGLALVTESGAFTAAHYDPTLSLSENYLNNFVLIFGLKTTNAPMKLLKKTDGRMKVPDDFQLTSADIRILSEKGALGNNLPFGQGKLNIDNFESLSSKEKKEISKQLFEYLEKEFKQNLTNNEKGELNIHNINRMTKILNSLPLNVQHKFLDAKNFRVEFDAIDALPHDIQLVDGYLVYKDYQGHIIQSNNIKEIPEIASGSMTAVDYMEAQLSQSIKTTAEYQQKDANFQKSLQANLKLSNISEQMYKDWMEGKFEKGGKLENKEIQDAIGEIVEYSTWEKKYIEKKATEKFNTLTLEQAVTNLKERGVDSPSGEAIANECMSIINRHKTESNRKNEVYTQIQQKQEEHNEALDNHQFIKGYEKGGVIYNNPIEGSTPVTTNIKRENSIDIGTVLGKELTKDHKNTLIKELDLKGELTPELKTEITNTKDFDGLIKLITEKTNYESVIFKNQNQLFESILGKENNSAISTSKESEAVKEREVTESDILTKENYETLLEQCETPAQRQVLEDGMKRVNKGDEVVIHNNKESFNKILEQDGVKVEGEGYEGSGYTDSKGVIHINKETQRGMGDAFHEGGHLDFARLKETNPEKYEQYINEVNDLLKNEGVLIDIKEIVKEYKVKEPKNIKEGETREQAIERETRELQGEEALIRISEALREGTLSEKDITAIKNSKVVDGFKTTLNDIFKELGIEKRIETNPEVIGFLENYIKDFNKTKTESLTKTVKDLVEGEGKLKISEIDVTIKDGEIIIPENTKFELKKELAGEYSLERKVGGHEIKVEVNEITEGKKGFSYSIYVDGKLQLSDGWEGLRLKDIKENLKTEIETSIKDYRENNWETIESKEGKTPEVKTEKKVEGDVKIYDESKTTDIGGGATFTPEAKTLETLVRELETLKSENAPQELIDSKIEEVNSARVKQAQAETGPGETQIEKGEKGEVTEGSETGEKGEVTEVSEKNEVIQIFNESKQLLENVDLNQYNERTVELIDKLKDVAILEGSPVSTEIAVELNNIVTNINNGTATPKQINDAFVKINTLEKSDPIIKGLKESIEKHGSKFRFLTGLTTGNVRFGKFGGIEVDNLNMLKRDLSTQNLSMLESYFFMEKDGLLTKHIVGPVQEAHVKYTTSVRESLTNWFNETKLNIEKLPDPTPFSVGGRLSGARSRRRKTMTKLGLLLAQRERNGIDGKDVWLEIKNGSDGGGSFTRGYSKSDVKLINEIYESLPKDKNGNIDMTKAFEGLSVKEKEILGVYESMMTNLREKQKVTNEINGIEFTEVDNYFPHLNKTRYDKNNQEITGNLSDKDFLDNLYDKTNTKIISDRGKQRTADGVLPIEFNLDRVMQNSILEINRDHIYTPVGKEVNTLLDGMKINNEGVSGTQKQINDGTNLAINGMQDRLKESVRVQLNQHGTGSKFMSGLFNVNYATQLVSARRLFFVEPIVETTRIGLTRSFSEYPDFVKQYIAGSNRRIQEVTSVGGRLHGVPLNTSLDIMKRTNSTGLLKNNRIGMEYESAGGTNTLQGANNYLLGMVDRMQMNLIWMPAFKSEFKKSGIEFNVKEYENNPDAYFKQHSKIFRESSRIADRELNKWKNESTKGGKRSKIDILGLTTLDATSGWAPIMTYMSNFGAQEAAMLNRSLKNIVRGDNSSRSLAVREMLGIYGSGMMYGTLSGVAYGFQQYYVQRSLLENQLDDKDYNRSDVLEKIHNLDLKWDEEYKNLTNSESITKEFITNGIFLANSKYSQAVKSIFGATIGIPQIFMDSPDEWRKAGGNWGVYADYREYVNKLLQDATYAKVPREPEDILMSALPQIEMAWDLFEKEAYPAVIDYINKGIYEADFEEKYREDINFVNFLNTSMKTLLFTQGKALPFLKDIQQITKGFYNFYGVDTEKVKEEFEELSKGVGEPYSSGAEEYSSGAEEYSSEAEEYSILNIDDKYVDDGGLTTSEKEKIKEDKGVQYIEIGEGDSLTYEQYQEQYGTYKWWDKTDTQLKTDFSKEQLRQLLPRDRFNRLFPY